MKFVAQRAMRTGSRPRSGTDSPRIARGRSNDAQVARRQPGGLEVFFGSRRAFNVSLHFNMPAALRGPVAYRRQARGLRLSGDRRAV
ncbi:hypothetical protein PSP6_70141 [Paraburkholderia tropica]|nr:hypothetical protein PSP6_70141 [Paraburkholderia tropica]